MRIAHFSDIHLLSHAGARTMQFANKRILGAANLLSNRSRHYHTEAFEDLIADVNTLGIEHILCTGDVTNLGFAQEFDFARARFDRLTAGTDNVTVLPGNHDAYVAEGGVHFVDKFAAYFATDSAWRWAARGAVVDPDDDGDDLRWPTVRVRGDLALIGLSTSRTTPWFTAYGRLGRGQLARLREALLAPELAGKARVVALHHPPAGKRARNRIRGLKDHEAFAAVIAEGGADVIVHGHEHRDLREYLPGPAGAQVEVLGVPSGTYDHNKPERTGRYRIIEIENGRVIGRSMRVWHSAGRRFAPDDAEQHPFHAST